MSDFAAADTAVSQAARRPAGKAFVVVPGLLLTAGIAGLAFALRRVPGLAMLSPMILATLLGSTSQHLLHHATVPLLIHRS